MTEKAKPFRVTVSKESMIEIDFLAALWGCSRSHIIEIGMTVVTPYLASEGKKPPHKRLEG